MNASTICGRRLCAVALVLGLGGCGNSGRVNQAQGGAGSSNDARDGADSGHGAGGGKPASADAGTGGVNAGGVNAGTANAGGAGATGVKADAGEAGAGADAAGEASAHCQPGKVIQTYPFDTDKPCYGDNFAYHLPNAENIQLEDFRLDAPTTAGERFAFSVRHVGILGKGGDLAERGQVLIADLDRRRGDQEEMVHGTVVQRPPGDPGR